MTLTIIIDLPNQPDPEALGEELAHILADCAAKLQSHPRYISAGYHRDVADGHGRLVGTLRID